MSLQFQRPLQVATCVVDRRRLAGQFRPYGNQAVIGCRLTGVPPLVGANVVQAIGEILGCIRMGGADLPEKKRRCLLAALSSFLRQTINACTCSGRCSSPVSRSTHSSAPRSVSIAASNASNRSMASAHSRRARLRACLALRRRSLSYARLLPNHESNRLAPQRLTLPAPHPREATPPTPRHRALGSATNRTGTPSRGPPRPTPARPG